MARIIPFRGILYNPNKISNLKNVITPPYDVISPEEQREYHARHPQNVIRLILGEVYPQDNADNNRYSRAAHFFHGWLEQEILVQDRAPAFYVTEIDYAVNGAPRTRLGFIALVQLEDFGTGKILPHEKTFSATKADRLKLIEACRANFCPVFSLFPDPAGKILGALRLATQKIAPDFHFEDLKGFRHRLWRVTDQQTHTEIGEMLAETQLYIADGHHRYETALEYRNQVMSTGKAFLGSHPSNYVMMSLSSTSDAGLTIRPVHRLVCGLPQGAMQHFLRKARAFFHVESLSFHSGNQTQVENKFLAQVREQSGKGVIGVVLRGHRAFHLLRAKEGIMDQLFEREIPAPLRRLDVTTATKLVLELIIGFDQTELDDEKRILYTSRAEKAIENVNSGKCALAVILSPTSLRQIQEVSLASLTMPRKSTYFYPKVMTGLVIYKM